ncbi:hypothetical protein GCM10010233_46300 [Streptomyces pseudogriseolus]|nr:hypothetical protein GCM10010233_46300 [Streptomyces gancidicus]
MTTATARSTTFPRIRKALKPCHRLVFSGSLTAGPLLSCVGCGGKRSATYVTTEATCPVVPDGGTEDGRASRGTPVCGPLVVGAYVFPVPGHDVRARGYGMHPQGDMQQRREKP